MRRYVLCLVLLLMIVGCKTVYVPVPGETKTEYVYQEKVDTTVIKDSVYIKEIQKGDTVWLTEYRYRDKYRYIYSTDTVIKVDSIAVPYEVEKIVKVPRDYTFGDKLLFKFGWFGIICLIAIGVWAFLKFYKNKIFK